jgi:hypothetical protein
MRPGPCCLHTWAGAGGIRLLGGSIEPWDPRPVDAVLSRSAEEEAKELDERHHRADNRRRGEKSGCCLPDRFPEMPDLVVDFFGRRYGLCDFIAHEIAEAPR